mgnify:CR=1 FL=1
MRIIVAITGASGSVITQRLLNSLKPHEVHLVISRAAERVMAHELTDQCLPASFRYSETDIDACIASTSFIVDAMTVAPCSMKTLAGIAHGYAENLIVRAAENTLRMGRRLVLVPRETPLSLAAIENMRIAKLAGAIILPPSVAYYHRPRTVDDITDFVVGKILDALGVEHDLYQRWQGPAYLAAIE